VIWWFLGGIELVGALFTATYGYLALKVAERPRGFAEWALWIGHCVGWIFPAIAGTYGFFAEDFED
jgi:hypothetical protein